jgi:hypothetical protein
MEVALPPSGIGRLVIKDTRYVWAGESVLDDATGSGKSCGLFGQSMA